MPTDSEDEDVTQRILAALRTVPDISEVDVDDAGAITFYDERSEHEYTLEFV